MSEATVIYGLMAEFESPEAILAAARRAREEGYRRTEAYTPFPIEDLHETLGKRSTWLPWIIFLAGCSGAAGGFFMQWFANVVHYPLNVGGRPHNSWPAWIPITFELTVLVSAIVGVIAMLARNGLPRLTHPVFNASNFDRASRDRFLLCIEASDPKFDLQRTREFLTGLHPLSIVEVSE